MEKLLNKLIEKGWKPRGYEKIYKFGIEKGFTVSQPQTKNFIGFATKSVWTEDMNEPAYTDYRAYTIRELASMESGLWQFCCDNNLIQTEHGCFIDNGERAKNVFYKVDTYDEEGDIIQTGDMEGDKFIGIYEYEYRLIESALCNEDSLEQFLVDNIKV